MNRQIDQTERTAKTKARALEVGDTEREGVASRTARCRLPREDDRRVEVRGRTGQTRCRGVAHGRLRPDRAEQRHDGQQTGRRQERKPPNYIHRYFVPAKGYAVAGATGL